jgi:DNA invertase Pin-like site-specific DNA recombinase
MLTVLGGLAEFERHLILSRTAEGRVRAIDRGVKFGRRPKVKAAVAILEIQHETAQSKRRRAKRLMEEPSCTVRIEGLDNMPIEGRA